MAPENLDRIDRGILFLLQSDARNVTTEEIGERVGVAASTVASRIRKLEESEVITGYYPAVDYEKSGFDQHLLVVGTAPPDETGAIVDDVFGVRGVVRVRELVTDEENVSVEVVAESQSDVERRIEELTDAGLRVSRTEVVKRDLHQSFDEFGERYVSDE